MTDQPVFYYDLGSPYAYLAAERINDVLPVVPVWQPILLGGIWQHTGGGSWARTEKRDEGMREIERRAEERGLQPDPLARALAHQHASPPCAPRPSPSRSAAPWPSPSPPSARRSPAAATCRRPTTC